MSITCKQTLAASDLRLGHVFEHHGDAYIQQHAPSQRQIVVMSHIRNCRTERMGRHFYRCDHCDWEEAVWNSVEHEKKTSPLKSVDDLLRSGNTWTID